MIILRITICIVLIIGVMGYIFLHQPKFGRLPGGERLERIKRSPNFRNGEFQNRNKTPLFTAEEGRFRSMWNFMFGREDYIRPVEKLSILKSDLHNLERTENVLVWFGHSSYFIQADGKRFLVDPVFIEASPVSFFNKPFKGPNEFRPSDIPEIDYLIISHDHWDHLDYKTVMELKERTEKVICALGVGEHFEHWGFDKDKIIEMDWEESAPLVEGFMVYCLPSRHFSGRGFQSNRTLWASFLVQTPTQRIYMAGDGGYDTHFAEIGKRFYPIDLAIMENGQYDKNWRYIHLMPEFMTQAVRDLDARQIMTVHHSKYALSKSPWNEPLENAERMAMQDSLPMIRPMMGEKVYFKK